jgi:hypothetical protein
MIIPTGSSINTTDNSKASAYKGKITELDQPPYILQNIQYTDAILIISYLIEIVYSSCSKEAPFFVKKISLILFEAFFIDHHLLIFRTLGYYPLDSDKDFYDHLSFLIAVTLLCIQIHQLIRIY